MLPFDSAKPRRSTSCCPAGACDTRHTSCSQGKVPEALERRGRMSPAGAERDVAGAEGLGGLEVVQLLIGRFPLMSLTAQMLTPASLHILRRSVKMLIGREAPLALLFRRGDRSGSVPPRVRRRHRRRAEPLAPARGRGRKARAAAAPAATRRPRGRGRTSRHSTCPWGRLAPAPRPVPPPPRPPGRAARRRRPPRAGAAGQHAGGGFSSSASH